MKKNSWSFAGRARHSVRAVTKARRAGIFVVNNPQIVSSSVGAASSARQFEYVAPTGLKSLVTSVLQRCRTYGAAALAFVLMTFVASAQSYSITSFTIGGGGGSSTNAQFSIVGTLGQHDAITQMTNSQFSASGGIWVLPQAVQTPDAPTLTIVPAAPGQATISWTPNTPGFVLQESCSLSCANWTNSPSGAANPITVPAPPPQKFYRLFKP